MPACVTVQLGQCGNQLGRVLHDTLFSHLVPPPPAAGAGHAAEEAERRARFLAIDTAAFCLYLVLVVLLTACARLSRYGELDFYLSEMVRESVLNSPMLHWGAIYAPFVREKLRGVWTAERKAWSALS